MYVWCVSRVYGVLVYDVRGVYMYVGCEMCVWCVYTVYVVYICIDINSVCIRV